MRTYVMYKNLRGSSQWIHERNLVTIFYSQQYFDLYVARPPVKAQRQNIGAPPLRFAYLQQTVGASGDTGLLQQLPPYSSLDLVTSWLRGSGLTAGLTLSLGWSEYTNIDGVKQPANPSGLYSSATGLGGVVFILGGGMRVVSTPASALGEMTASPIFEPRNRSSVDIFCTFTGQPPGAGATLQGVFYLC
jgi:hypothetical protein